MSVYFIGGTIGLFTGLSLISMVEIAFWIIRTVLKIGSMGMKGRKKEAEIIDEKTTEPEITEQHDAITVDNVE